LWGRPGTNTDNNSDNDRGVLAVNGTEVLKSPQRTFQINSLSSTIKEGKIFWNLLVQSGKFVVENKSDETGDSKDVPNPEIRRRHHRQDL